MLLPHWSYRSPSQFAAAALVLALAACTVTPATTTAPVAPLKASPKIAKKPVPVLTAAPVGGKFGTIVSNGGAKIDLDAFANQLQDVAVVAHNRAAGQLLSNNAAGVVSNNGGTLLANNAAGLLANNSAGLVSNNSGGLVSNNSGGLVSNNSGGMISNNAAGYMLAALSAFQLAQASADFASANTADEEPGTAFDYPDGTKGIVFYRLDGTASRIVVTNKEGQQLEQQIISKEVRNAEDALLSSHTERTLVYGNDHRSRGFLAYDEAYDAQGRLLSLTHLPSFIEEPFSKLKLTVQKLAFTVEPAQGEFEIRFEHLGAVETGTINQVVRDIQGKGVGIDLTDPLSSMGGTSTFSTTSGKKLFDRKTVVTAGQPTKLTMTLQDGWAFEVSRSVRTAPYMGDVTYEGVKIGTVSLTQGADAAVTYEVRIKDVEPIVVQLASPTTK